MPLCRALRVLADWTFPTTLTRCLVAARHPSLQRALFATVGARTAEWALTTLIVVLAYAHALQLDHVALALLAQLVASVLGRMLATQRRSPLPLALLSLLWLAPAGAFVAAVMADASLTWLILLAATTTLIGSAASEQHAHALYHRAPRHLVGVLNATLGRLEAFATIVGAGVIGILLFLDDVWPAAAFIGVVIVASTIFTLLDPNERVATPRSVAPAPLRYRQPVRRLLSLQQVRVLTVMLLLGAMVSVLLRTALVVTLTDTHDARIGFYGLLIALVGVGAIVGPIPVFRLLGHLRPSLLLGGILGAGAIMAGASLVLPVLILVALPLLAVGLLAVTGDRVAATVIRRSLRTDDARHALQVLGGGVLVGQLLALSAIALLTRWISVEALLFSTCMLTLGAAALLTQIRLDDPLHAAPTRLRQQPRLAAAVADGAAITGPSPKPVTAQAAPSGAGTHSHTQESGHR